MWIRNTGKKTPSMLLALLLIMVAAGMAGNVTAVGLNPCGVNLTNISALFNASSNAIYILSLNNSGTAADSYTLVVDNPNSAQTASLNITSPVVLNASETRIFTLNVNHSLSGTFHVNVTARSNNDTSKFGYLNTTTIINWTINDSNIGTMINTSNFLTNATVNITAPSGNVIVTIFNGTNASVNGTYLASISVDSIAFLNPTLVANLGSDKLIGENLALYPEGAHFSPDIQLRFNYSDSQLAAAGISSAALLRVKFYNTSTNSWDEQTTYSINESQKYVIANVSHFSTFALVGTPASLTNNNNKGVAGGGGGGGGGGGTSSGENYSNIIVKEKHDLDIIKDKVASYMFTNRSNPVVFVNITGSINAGEINTAVEVLRNASSLVRSSAPGAVYKNFNIWVGTSGFAVPRNIKDAVIRFRIENSWLDSNSPAGNDIKLVRWDGNEWVQLETKEKDKDSIYTYFEGSTANFSSFAITVVKEEVASTPALTATSSIPTGIAAAAPDVAKETSGFGIIMAAIALWALYLPARKIR
jgi:PGF-pre-PGF domain-containing protein